MNMCKICKEPIWNFICIDCIARDVKRHFPAKLLNSFTRFHRNLHRHFHSATDRFMPCLTCKLSNAPAICIPCYMNEAQSWAKAHGLMGMVGKKFSFDFTRLERELREHNALPITESENFREKSGLCDMCGEYSDSLMLVDSEWICEECKE